MCGMNGVSLLCLVGELVLWCFFFQAEDGIRDLVRSRGLGDVYKRQCLRNALDNVDGSIAEMSADMFGPPGRAALAFLRLSLIHI